LIESFNSTEFYEKIQKKVGEQQAARSRLDQGVFVARPSSSPIAGASRIRPRLAKTVSPRHDAGKVISLLPTGSNPSSTVISLIAFEDSRQKSRMMHAPAHLNQLHNP